MKILVVDDESSIRNLIRMQLEMEGYEVLAADGESFRDGMKGRMY